MRGKVETIDVRLLLDTHALLWWLDGDAHLPSVARKQIGSGVNEIFVSAATAWEICTKFRLGKLDKAADVARDVTACLESQGFLPLPILVSHGARAGSLPGLHRDPFDRMLIAQALLEEMTLVSGESLFDRYGVQRLW